MGGRETAVSRSLRVSVRRVTMRPKESNDLHVHAIRQLQSLALAQMQIGALADRRGPVLHDLRSPAAAEGASPERGRGARRRAQATCGSRLPLFSCSLVAFDSSSSKFLHVIIEVGFGLSVNIAL